MAVCAYYHTIVAFCAKCAYSLKVTKKSDVYSMSIVLMELVTGLMPADNTFCGDMDMVRWLQSGIDAPRPVGASVGHMHV
jgi:hypothetical protein